MFTASPSDADGRSEPAGEPLLLEPLMGGAEAAWVGGVGISALVHVALVFCLGTAWAWMAEPDAGQPRDALLVTTAEPPAELPPEAFAVSALPSARAAEPSHFQATVGGRAAGDLLANPRIQAVEPRLHPSRPPVEIGLPGGAEIAGSLTEDVGPLAGSGGPGGSGSGSGGGDGAGVGDGFFGRRHADGKSFVYVVDCSRSMGAPHRSQWKTRLGRVKVELINSISTLSPEQSFFVIFFNGGSHPMPATGLLDATPENKQKCLEWVVSVPPAGETDPRQALLLALRLEPEVIYFLTDGAFRPNIRGDLGRIKQRRSAIHTFAFGDRAGERTLEAIAKQNRGEYHFVP